MSSQPTGGLNQSWEQDDFDASQQLIDEAAHAQSDAMDGQRKMSTAVSPRGQFGTRVSKKKKKKSKSAIPQTSTLDLNSYEDGIQVPNSQTSPSVPAATSSPPTSTPKMPASLPGKNSHKAASEKSRAEHIHEIVESQQMSTHGAEGTTGAGSQQMETPLSRTRKRKRKRRSLTETDPTKGNIGALDTEHTGDIPLMTQSTQEDAENAATPPSSSRRHKKRKSRKSGGETIDQGGSVVASQEQVLEAPEHNEEPMPGQLLLKKLIDKKTLMDSDVIETAPTATSDMGSLSSKKKSKKRRKTKQDGFDGGATSQQERHYNDDQAPEDAMETATHAAHPSHPSPIRSGSGIDDADLAEFETRTAMTPDTGHEAPSADANSQPIVTEDKPPISVRKSSQMKKRESGKKEWKTLERLVGSPPNPSEQSKTPRTRRFGSRSLPVTPHIKTPSSRGSWTPGTSQSGRRKGRAGGDPTKTYKRAPRDDADQTMADKALDKQFDVSFPSDLRTGGEFSDDERELIRRAIMHFQERNGLDTSDLVAIIQYTKPYRNVDDLSKRRAEGGYQDQEASRAFWQEVNQIGLNRNMITIQRFIRRNYSPFKSAGGWTDEEDQLLKSLYEAKPGQWKFIAEEMGTRGPDDCRDRWRNYLQYGEGRNTKRWTEAEEASMIRAISEVAQRDEDFRAESGQPPLSEYTSRDINWSAVCTEMNNIRSRIQCQQKWKTMLNRSPTKRPHIQPRIHYRETPTVTKPAGGNGIVKKLSKKRRRSQKQQNSFSTQETGEDLISPSKQQRFQQLDLIETIIDTDCVDQEELDWDEIAARIQQKTGRSCSIIAMQNVLNELLESVDTRDGFTNSLENILSYISERDKEDEEEQQSPFSSPNYHTPNTSNKRKLKGQSAQSRFESSVKSALTKYLSKEFITASDDED